MACTLGVLKASDVAVHRRSGKTGEVYRAVAEVDCGPEVDVETFRGCLLTPEARPLWDRMVEESVTMDLLDAHTRISRTSYRLGWPSSPRDVVTISKTLVDNNTLIDITTSLPRSRNEPPYLRPSPPHVRAHVSILGWCIQVAGGRAKLTCMWSWDPKGAWAVGGGVPQHLPSVMVGMVNYTREGSERVPVLQHFGQDVSIGSITSDPARGSMSVAYAIVSDHGAIEFALSQVPGWDVQVHSKEQSWTEITGQASGNRVLRI